MGTLHICRKGSMPDRQEQGSTHNGIHLGISYSRLSTPGDRGTLGDTEGGEE